ncbi:FAD-dependent oxidoreductase [Tengunoibacter tsumagoiensis]|uniref:FAD-binding domain-containing protein n=1 Tax=Tengunoibacter tsumagoiensis TaxID=2014871 RepID=A0A402A3G6_9CHLR|nr:FAD-dependent monooxygenase [Tengunoibacter tsumagoiensis]GCE13684.1 hypothetical protein KTT_35430 [Tengunoibacter tsumagoiensis]
MSRWLGQQGCLGRHAIVIGASITGLLVGQLLSSYFEQVTIIERDNLSQTASGRKGVPQGAHPHLLLYKGVTIVEELFPDLFPALVAQGALKIDLMENLHWFQSGRWKLRQPSPFKGYLQSRPLFESQMRACLLANDTVQILDSCSVIGLRASEDGQGINGVVVQRTSGDREAKLLEADLVVDASGRGSQAPRWLSTLGYDQVNETTIKIDLGYTTRIYRRPPTASPHRMLVIYPDIPTSKRAGYVIPIEGERWLVMLAGWLNDHAPVDEDGFQAFARSLPVPDLSHAIQSTTPLSQPMTYKFSANRWRHYEKLSRWPAGFLVLGDAVCSFNPVYGQGMTVAALEVQLLQKLLRSERERKKPDLRAVTKTFHKEVAKVVSLPWLMATGEDLQYPEVQGARFPGFSLFGWYFGKVLALTSSNSTVYQHFGAVLNMEESPLGLISPPVLMRVLFGKVPEPASDSISVNEPEMTAQSEGDEASSTAHI